MKITLYQPDIPQNVGAMIRLCACMNVGLDIIDPCGFIWDKRKIRQAALDYYDYVTLQSHKSWSAFLDHYQGHGRVILMTTKTDMPYTDFTFREDDILLAGRESSGVPVDVFNAVHGHITIPMQSGMRSLNIVNAASMILGEALRQTRWHGAT